MSSTNITEKKSEIRKPDLLLLNGCFVKFKWKRKVFLVSVSNGQSIVASVKYEIFVLLFVKISSVRLPWGGEHKVSLNNNQPSYINQIDKHCLQLPCRPLCCCYYSCCAHYATFNQPTGFWMHFLHVFRKWVKGQTKSPFRLPASLQNWLKLLFILLGPTWKPSFRIKLSNIQIWQFDLHFTVT